MPELPEVETVVQSIRHKLIGNEFEKIEKGYTHLIANASRYNYFSEIGTRMTETFLYEDANLAILIEHPRVMEVMRDISTQTCWN